MRRLIAAAGALLAAIAVIPLNAQEIRDVDVTVRLQKDGSAHVTQVWDATVVAGTEWYIPVNNLGKMEIVDFEAQACLLAGSGVEQTNCVYDDELG